MARNILKPLLPNAGLEMAYRSKMQSLIDDMHRSVVYWVSAGYRANPPEMALDASPAAELRKIMQRLGRYWNKRFADLAPALAAYFAENASDRVSSTLLSMLKASGIAVSFKLTAEVNDVLQATIGEQVGLIKSIPQQYLGTVEGMVMRSVQTGRDLKQLTDDLTHAFGITKRRAAFIALDQNNKATATIKRARELELGITKGVWMHSHAGKDPRPEHQKWDHEEYDIEKGKWSEVDKCYVWPGTAIRCRCIGRPIIPGLTRRF
jgi:uncharacterized protein with gpF-like domain